MGSYTLSHSLLLRPTWCSCVCNRVLSHSAWRPHSTTGTFGNPRTPRFLEDGCGQFPPSNKDTWTQAKWKSIHFQSGVKHTIAISHLHTLPIHGQKNASKRSCTGLSASYSSSAMPVLGGQVSSFLVPTFQPLKREPIRHSSTEPTTVYETLLNSQPVHFAESVFQQVHSLTGLPWWASIVATTISLRLALTLPLAIYSQNIRAKVESLQPEVISLAKQAFVQRFAPRAKNEKWSEKRAQRAFVGLVRHYSKELYIRDNCHPAKGSILLLVQLPMWVFLSLALRNMTGAFSDRMFVDPSSIVPDLAMGGALWFPSLVAPDPALILPILVGVLNLANIEMHALHKGRVTRVQRYLNNTLRMVSVVMVPIAASVPSAMALYWTASACYGLGQNILLKIPTARQTLGIRPCMSDSETPFKDMGEEFVVRYLRGSSRVQKEAVLEELKDEDDRGQRRDSGKIPKS